FSGYLWQGAAGQSVWRIHHSGALTLRVDGQVLFDLSDLQPEGIDEVVVSWSGEALFLEVDYRFSGAEQPGRPMLAIYESGPSGAWRLLPTNRLYPTAPAPALARQDDQRNKLGWLAGGIAAAASALLVALLLLAYRPWRSRNFWLAVGLVLVSLIVRLILLN